MLRWAMVGDRAIGVGPKGTRCGGPELRHAASAVLACALVVAVGGCAREADDALLSERGAAGPSSEEVEDIFEDAIAMASDVESAELSTSIRFGSERFELVGAWSTDGIEAAEHRRNDSVADVPVRELHGSVDHELAYDRASPDERAAMDRVLSFPVFTHFEADVGIDAMGRDRTLEYDIGSGDGTGVWVWGNFTEEEFAEIAEALTAG
jgi:hypothetical protein